MSDDDWENAIDEVVESGTKEETTTKDKFKDEDAYDSEEERNKKAEALKLAAAAKAEPARVKAQGKDYDKMFEERNKKRSAPTATLQKAGD